MPRPAAALVLIGPGPRKLFEAELSTQTEAPIVAVETVDDTFPTS